MSHLEDEIKPFESRFHFKNDILVGCIVGPSSSRYYSSSIVRELHIKLLFGIFIGFSRYDFPIHKREYRHERG
jgi:hypothetical protein